ncbi:bifunctional methylenetetrahydrofolate dehydrogenase/methenyltetrahydrofolate cyclohydrolase [Patescibacteria group bacterium]|nr:bifunctional methylenetetrahydrofolate dehydrogenase/methenyltetrahydrofolate cyclohydrolase [Patescibacteria group bacterium]
MEILDGRKVANEIYDNLANEVQKLNKEGLYPKLVVILVGNDPASLSYIKQKRIACEKTGIIWEQINYDPSITTEDLIEKIHELNEQKDIHGILVQLPLPKHIYEPEVIKAIDPRKDVDGFTAYNLGKMFLSTEFEHLPPCTPAGIIDLLDRYHIEIKGKNVTIVGSSNIVGKPLATMFINRKATVTVCNSSTKDLKAETLKADIVAVGVGKQNLITADMVKDNVIVIDIGCNKKADGKLCGDTDFENISKKASFITPVPGGIGPMTVAHLMKNTVNAAKRLR